MADEHSNKSAYGNRPLWQWILIYLVIGGIIYAIIYFFFFTGGTGTGGGGTGLY